MNDHIPGQLHALRIVDEYLAADAGVMRQLSAIAKGREVFAFECGVVGQAPTRTMNHRSAGKAKAAYLRDVRDCWPDVEFIDLYARKVGEPRTSDAFTRNAEYRGMPGLRCGQRVEVNTPGQDRPATGAIVGHNGSANFDVLFDDDSPRFAGMVLNVHPGDIKLINTTESEAACR